MGTSLPTYWHKPNDPDEGIFRLVMLTGWEIGGDPANRKVLYVCKSLSGGLNEAFEWNTEVPSIWRPWMGALPNGVVDEDAEENQDKDRYDG
jgi:hypothetical protein